MSQLITDLEKIRNSLNKCEINPVIDQLLKAAFEIHEVSSGSWIGYHANIYYKNFHPSTPGDSFDSEWGFTGGNLTQFNSQNWTEYSPQDVIKYLYSKINMGDTTFLKAQSKECAEIFQDAKDDFLSLMSVTNLSNDAFFQETIENIKKQKINDANDYIPQLKQELGGNRQIFTRDTKATAQGLRLPPHISVIAEAFALKEPFDATVKLIKQIDKIIKHVKNKENYVTNTKIEKVERENIFIGHGRSPIWRELKEFLKERLNLTPVEFNSESPIGKTTIDRLKEMLDSSSFAFLIMTAEDQQPDGKLNPRLNVVHEVGLFQGKLGFDKAIILLENGCEDFSNIHGLTYISFSKNSIKDTYEEVREILEKHSIIPPSK